MIIALFTVNGQVFALPENQMQNLGVSCVNHSARTYSDVYVLWLTRPVCRLRLINWSLGQINSWQLGGGLLFSLRAAKQCIA